MLAAQCVSDMLQATMPVTSGWPADGLQAAATHVLPRLACIPCSCMRQVARHTTLP